MARKMGRNSELVDINVFFGNDFKNPLPIGQQEKNRYGAIRLPVCTAPSASWVVTTMPRIRST